MPNVSFRTLSVKPAGSGALLVEIVGSDRADITTSQEMVSLVVRIEVSENPTLSEIRLAAVRRAQTLLEECNAAAAPKTSS
jgi:hypothetical protein